MPRLGQFVGHHIVLHRNNESKNEELHIFPRLVSKQSLKTLCQITKILLHFRSCATFYY